MSNKQYIKFLAIILSASAVVALIAWAIVSLPKVPESEIVSRGGIHYHAELSIFINGKKQDVPAGVGLTGWHNPIHTHEADNIIHLEFNGLVKKDDTRLGNFFKIWGKDFSSQNIFEHKNGEGGMVKMFVNGKENGDYENYPMKDGDKIEIRYEPYGTIN